MSEIPSEFFSKKTYQSLPRLALLTWLIVFIIDAVILQRFPYTFTRVLYIWAIGMIVSFLFELGRYRNLNEVDKADYKKYFMLLNAFIIFLYASSYTGLTKQVGAWGGLKETVNDQAVQVRNIRAEKAGIFLAAVEWAIPVLAKQTSYFPDVTAIAENNDLKKQNTELKDVISRRKDDRSPFEIDSLKKINSDLNNKIITLNGNLTECSDNLAICLNTAAKRSGSDSLLRQTILLLTAKIRSLQSDNTSLQNQNAIFSNNLSQFIARINASNVNVSRLLELRNIPCISKGEVSAFRMLNEMCSANVMSASGNFPAVNEYKSILFNLRPISTVLK